MGEDSPAGWATISELARLRGVDKAAISRRVARLEAQGLLKSRPGSRGTKIVNIAEFDRAAGVATDAVRELNGRGAAAADLGSPPAGPSDPILAKEQARRAAYDADLKKLDLDERLGKLIPRDNAIEAAGECALRLRRAVEQMHNRAEENAAAVAKDGVTGARDFLKTLERELLVELARMAALFDGDWQAEFMAAEGEGLAESHDAALRA